MESIFIRFHRLNSFLIWNWLLEKYEALFWVGYKVVVMSFDNYSQSKYEPITNEHIASCRQWNLSFLVFFLLHFGVVVFLCMDLNNTNVVHIKQSMLYKCFFTSPCNGFGWGYKFSIILIFFSLQDYRQKCKVDFTGEKIRNKINVETIINLNICISN